jgi:hypothetical protein
MACQKYRSFTKICKAVADVTGYPRQRVKQILEAFNQEFVRDMATGGPGEFVIPHTLKIVRKLTKALPERKGWNPIERKVTLLKAKPAKWRFYARPMMRLKELKPPKDQ